jgi:hypothetical protein
MVLVGVELPVDAAVELNPSFDEPLCEGQIGGGIRAEGGICELVSKVVGIEEFVGAEVQCCVMWAWRRGVSHETHLTVRVGLGETGLGRLGRSDRAQYRKVHAAPSPWT